MSVQDWVQSYRVKLRLAEAEGVDRTSALVELMQELRRTEDDPMRMHVLADAMLLAALPERVADAFIAVPRWYE